MDINVKTEFDVSVKRQTFVERQRLERGDEEKMRKVLRKNLI